MILTRTKQNEQMMLTFKIESIKRQSSAFPAFFLYSGQILDLTISEVRQNYLQRTENEHIGIQEKESIVANLKDSSATQTYELHISNDCLSPKMQNNYSGHDYSDFTVSILDENQAMLSCFQGISRSVVVDENSLAILWGSSVAILYQDIQSLRNFLIGVKKLEIKHINLAVSLKPW